MHVLVIGGGVSGLTTALSLLEANHTVVIWTRERAAHTTSSVAAATWYPYAVGGAHADAWSVASFDIFQRLAQHPQETGVIVRPLRYLMRQPEERSPSWKQRVGARDLAPDELPHGYTAGFTFDSPVIDMSIYLRSLEQRIDERSGRIEERTVAGWGDAFAAWEQVFAEAVRDPAQPRVIVNCAGLDARSLVAEDANDSPDGLGVRPARGQVVRVAANGFDQTLLEESDETRPTYVVPRINDIVLGGSYEVGKDMRAVDLALRDDILTRCARLLLHYDRAFAMSLAALVGGETEAQFRVMVGEHYAKVPAARLRASPDDCGLRPIRAEVALKRQTLGAGQYVVHNYGHGGGGVTLSWGCAHEVVKLIASL